MVAPFFSTITRSSKRLSGSHSFIVNGILIVSLGGNSPPLGTRTSKPTEPEVVWSYAHGPTCSPVSSSWGWAIHRHFQLSDFSSPKANFQRTVTSSGHWMKLEERDREMIKKIQDGVGREPTVFVMESNRKFQANYSFKKLVIFYPSFIHSIPTMYQYSARCW